MLPGLLGIVAAQLAGEFLVALLGLPVPGTIVGMALLLVALLIARPEPEASVFAAADELLGWMPLLFVPAGAGLILYLHLFAEQWLPIVAGVLLSWLAAVLVTIGVGAGILRLQRALAQRRAA
ncbi:MAG: CidA/LrgA family protein [Microbacteriaceae bacterium]